ncbi:hypothetical protein ACFO6R_12635 [Eubacterium multiforme]|uniref:CRISPR/Cas system-associated endonuclease/helicase Cas3 n=1 Tax=Eubacterium multiforme TaxID=83339 RepID=A0ABT9UWA7_9FIRM|nr:hypothetical protein [Eubacterium multiforme]MDQ0150584.1 CRISPR/Cas system-associated endonuclease/helicase Cas3 [Eubacterium multiforme]
MKFSKKRFKENAPRNVQRLLKEHLDILDGMEVEISNFDKRYFEIKEYFYNGESYNLYPIKKEWCE